LLPRVREAGPDTAVLADGFSCRTQLHELDSGGREGVHLAELLAGALDSPAEQPRRLGRAAVLAAAATLGVAIYRRRSAQ
jgi:hypothetical protein